MTYSYGHQTQVKFSKVIMRKKSIASVGCFLTCLAMKFTAEAGRLITPPMIDAWMDNNDGYIPGGDGLIWGKIVEYAQSLGLTYKRCERLSYGQLIVTEQMMGQILEVQTARNTTHFVLCLGTDTGVPIFLDPGTRRDTHFTCEDRQFIPKSWRVFT